MKKTFSQSIVFLLDMVKHQVMNRLNVSLKFAKTIPILIQIISSVEWRYMFFGILQRTNWFLFSGVHCTHGFNRTGFLICAYLCREHDMSIDAAIDLFAKARPTGIYKQDYLNELVRRYGDESSVPILAPPRAEWCLSKWIIRWWNE